MLAHVFEQAWYRYTRTVVNPELVRGCRAIVAEADMPAAQGAGATSRHMHAHLYMYPVNSCL